MKADFEAEFTVGAKRALLQKIFLDASGKIRYRWRSEKKPGDESEFQDDDINGPHDLVDGLVKEKSLAYLHSFWNNRNYDPSTYGACWKLLKNDELFKDYTK